MKGFISKAHAFDGEVEAALKREPRGSHERQKESAQAAVDVQPALAPLGERREALQYRLADD